MTETLLSAWTSGLLLAAAVLPQPAVAWKFWRFTIILAIAAAVAMSVFSVFVAGGTIAVVARASCGVALAGCGIWLGLLLVAAGQPLKPIVSFAPFAAAAAGAVATCAFAAAARVVEPQPSIAAATLLASAAVVGLGSMAAMLGHAYLTATAMPIDPLRRSVSAYGVAVAAHTVLGAIVCWRFFATHSDAGLAGVFWLAVAIMYAVIGLAAPPAFAVMAWQAVRVRNTQSTTGIMYFGMVLNFIGALALCFLLRGE